MDEKTWTKAEDYLQASLGLTGDAVLDAVLKANADAGLPQIDVSALEGQFLGLLVRMCGATRILEIGTLGGYSALCMARQLPDTGHLVTLEADPAHAEVAQANIASAGLADKTDVRIGAALDLLPELQGEGPFDLVFIDADKRNNVAYLEWAMKLSRPGTVIVVDNVVRKGAVVESESSDSSIQGARAAIEYMGRHPRISATALQTVGAKGYDGFALGIVI